MIGGGQQQSPLQAGRQSALQLVRLRCSARRGRPPTLTRLVPVRHGTTTTRRLYGFFYAYEASYGSIRCSLRYSYRTRSRRHDN
eukprot:scaffold42926_cov21-Prasinocladus_malaysianus.AAC.1